MIRGKFGSAVWAGLAIAVMGGLATEATAASVTFASFQQVDSGATPWTFTNSGASSTFTVSAPVNVNFQSTTGLGQIINFSGVAIATLTATVNGLATNSGGIISQNFALGADLKFVNAADTAQTVLDVAFIGAITGRPDGTGSLGASSAAAGQVISYSSNYLVGAFIQPFTFSLSIDTPLSVNANGYLNSFSTASTGTFSANGAGAGANPTAPLPSAAVAGFGMLSLGGLGLRFRRVSGRHIQR